MKLIPLTKGYSVQVSDEDFDFLSQWKWHYNGHAERKEKGRHVLMHRVITGAKEGELVDHINGNPLDNRRENLRSSNHSTNAMNMRKHRGKSVYKGVTQAGKGWRVQIWQHGKPVFSANAPTERWAAMIYDLNAPVLFGEYARLNFGASTVGKSAAAPPVSPQ